MQGGSELMNKKASYSLSKEWGLWVIRVAIVVVVLVFIYFMVGFNISKQENLEGFSPMILKQRLVYSPDCFVYQNENNSRPGVFDIEKLTQKRLLSCLSEMKEGVRIEITSKDKTSTFEINSDVLSDKSLCQFKKTMSCNRDVAYVLIKDKDKLIPVYMSIRVMDYK